MCSSEDRISCYATVAVTLTLLLLLQKQKRTKPAVNSPLKNRFLVRCIGEAPVWIG